MELIISEEMHGLGSPLDSHAEPLFGGSLFVGLALRVRRFGLTMPAEAVTAASFIRHFSVRFK